MDLEDAALEALGTGARLSSFSSLSTGASWVTLDLDHYAENAVVVWLAKGRGENALEGTVVFSRADRNADWDFVQSSEGEWVGWSELAASRPAQAWPAWGPILALGVEGADGPEPEDRYQSVRGIAAAEVVGIEFGPRDHTRRRSIDSPTGAFIVALSRRPGDSSPIVRLTLRGGRVVDLNR